jgi:hypothetical protein
VYEFIPAAGTWGIELFETLVNNFFHLAETHFFIVRFIVQAIGIVSVFLKQEAGNERI